MLHISNNKIAVDYDARIAGLFPQARELTHAGNKLIVVPHDYKATAYLRTLGHDVPAPVLSQYDWPAPAGEPPFDVQKSTVALMTTERRAYVLNGLGTGKTRCTLWAFDYLKRAGLANKMLVVCTVSTMHETWQREAFRVFPHLKTTVLDGAKERRHKRLAEEWDIAIINHDGVQTILQELQKRPDIDTFALDELAVYRNGKSKRTTQMKELVKGRAWCWGLTGSPVPKAPTDIHGQALVLTPHTVPKYFSHLRGQLMYKAGPFKWEPKDDAVERAFAMMQPSVRFSLDDIVELPEVVMRFVEVPLGPKQQKAYSGMKNAAVTMIGDKKIDALNAGAALSKLLQIALGWVYTRDGETVQLDNKARIDTIIDNINESSRKVIVFLPFKSALKGLSEALSNPTHGEKIEHAVVSGDTPASERREIFGLFQRTDKYKALVAHPACMAHGLTLTAADTVIWGAPTTDLEIFLQANGRITRLGQKHKQLVLMLGGTRVERRIYDALGKKEIIQNMLLDLIADASK